MLASRQHHGVVLGQQKSQAGVMIKFKEQVFHIRKGHAKLAASIEMRARGVFAEEVGGIEREA